jgi:type II secretory pathway pseudopilin PulG
MLLRLPRLGRRRQGGMLLIGVLVFIALSALTAVHAGPRWFDARQRAAEEELLFVGEQYRQAIESYWREAPNAVQKMPGSVDDLIADKRFPFPKRHLRKEFRDPLAPELALAEIREGDALLGVYSRAEGTPFRQAGFTGPQKSFNGAQSYAGWKFSFVPTIAPAQTKAPGVRP